MNHDDQVAGMASRHGSQFRCNRTAEYHRTVNPALLHLRKLPDVPGWIS